MREINALLHYKSGYSRTFNVLGYLEDYGIHEDEYRLQTKDGFGNAFKDGKGYIDESGNIWIYKKTKPTTALGIPWFSFTEEEIGDEIRTTFSWNKKCLAKIKEYFKEENLSSSTVESIASDTEEDEVLYNQEMLDDLNAGGDIWIPEIKKTDDFLKLIVKNILIDNIINLNSRKHLMPKSFQISNLKAGLKGDTKTSPTTFNIFSELLGFEFDITVRTKSGGKFPPLRHEYKYTSYNNKVEINEVTDKEK